MASPYQQQAFQRKLTYGGLILVLLTVSWGWRRIDWSVLGLPVRGIDAQAAELSIREQSRGEVELTGAFVRLGLIGSRGVATCVLWSTAIEKQKKNQWNELEVIVRALTKLQPHFVTPWLFQSWNLSYNVSVEADRVSDKYFYMTRGIDLLARGERQNRNNPDLRWSIGFFTQHKIGQSDETNTLRSLFTLSQIPPNERDPRRFRVHTAEGDKLNGEEFAKFCRKFPQLVRRLHSGMHRETRTEADRQFKCENPERVVQFLADNQGLPGLYANDRPAAGADWQPHEDTLLRPEDRFPLLPPERTVSPPQHLFDPEALTDQTPLIAGTINADQYNAFAVAHSWFAYAQEPLPDPDELPGSNKEITDRARQRRPRHITTLIFRNYPAQAQRYVAERLQQEGWFDDQPWEITGWFEADNDRFADGQPAQVGGGRPWSQDAWERAAKLWREHGESNHLLFPSQEAEENMLAQSRAFMKKYQLSESSAMPALREENLDEETREQFKAYRYMREYAFYRQVSNFPHHHARSEVEAKPETVAARKLFYEAESLNQAGSRQAALATFRRAIPLWRDKILLRNKDFRRDQFIQEQTAELQWKYLALNNRLNGRGLKEKLAPVVRLAPLAPPLRQDVLRYSVVQGPFDIRDGEGHPLIEPGVHDQVRQRLNLTYRGIQPGAPPTAAEAPAGAPADRRPSR